MGATSAVAAPEARSHHDALVGVLRAAYSGELAAAYAYRGHWRSLRRVSRADQRHEIRRIEAAEWHHRGLVAEMLAELGSRPVRRRELVMGAVGRFFGFVCHVGGYFGPMYAAGRLEGANVAQYELAARHAAELHHDRYVDLLAAMVEEEARHERFFGDCIRRHPLLPIASLLLGWSPPAS